MARDITATRALLIAAARDEFARHGIGGARVERIAQQAGVSKERIYGHFGSKEKLFEAVTVEVLAEHTTALGLPSGDVVEYVGRIYDFHRDNPQLLRLLLWEAQHYGAEPAGDDGERREHYAEKVAALAQILGTEPDQGTAATLLTLIGLAVWPHAVPQLARLIVGGTPEQAQEVIRARVLEFARLALSTERLSTAPAPAPAPAPSS
ncbi:TetR family transcriptional regulator [Kitasatospora kifunensis]|uniref:AcrR family transcriptional regulator n=1 Tax=Kitasatospora kifunensis TaxID=58351 RepID=A0A7W7VT99_KITKI|nr:TetR family transcriptional regulator [Kitasatospora kifunensis]MBB4922002.1 AcrR family transcriptional regulator [Kitasatospora kifunensis]